MKSLALKIAFFSICLVASPTLFAQSGMFPGDFDNDSTISLTDFAAFRECMNGPVTELVEPQCFSGDIDADQDIDLADLRHFQQQFAISACRTVPFDVENIPFDNPSSLLITDLNNDMIQDVVATEFGSPAALAVSFGQADGTHGSFEWLAEGGVYALASSADFDQDGHADLVVAGIPDVYHITVFYGDGQGGLTSVPEVPTSCVVMSRALGLTTGDFDGNGWPDILVSTKHGLSCFLNNGDQSFGDPVCLDTHIPLNSTIGDFNSDGFGDVVADDTGGIILFLSNGDGSFSEQWTYSTMSSTHFFAPSDIDTNGILDLVVTNSTAQSISVFFGVGDGTFSLPTDHYLQYKPSMVLTKDMNLDGVPDVLTSTNGGVMVLLGAPDGTLNEQQIIGHGLASNNEAPLIAIGEFNFDAHQDVIIGSRAADVVVIVSGQTDGRFEAPSVYPSSGSGDRVIADFDNDGDQDVAVLGYGHIQVHSNVDSGALIETGDYVTETRDGGRMAIADINRDGDLDLLAVSYGWHYLNVLLGKDGVAFDEPSIYYVGSYVSAMAVTDYNNDSFVDVVLTNYAGILLWPGQMDGTFPSSVLVETEGTPDDVIAADFNHDGYSDLAILNSYFEAIDILLGAGDGTFGQIASEPTIADSVSLAFGDIDNDGMRDLIAVAKDGLGLHVLNEDGTLEPVITVAAVNSGEPVAVADVNYDSRADIIYVQTSSTSSASILYGAGGGVFELPVSVNFFDGVNSRQAVQAADMTNDGLIDLVVFNDSSITVAPNFCGP